MSVYDTFRAYVSRSKGGSAAPLEVRDGEDTQNRPV